jgi:ureidoacrylate peracid hydrolase
MKFAYGKQVRDTLAELVDPKIAALVVIDIQNDFCSPDGLFAKAGRDMSLVAANAPKMIEFVQAAQRAGILTVFVRQNTLPNGLSDSPAWLRLKLRDGKSPEYGTPGTWGWQLCDGLQVRTQDIVIDKFRPDAFVRTELDLVLRANGIETTVIVGANTEGCVESTVRSACHHDYYTVIVEDCVASSLPRFHETSLALMKNRFVVRPAREILEHWPARS